MGNQYCVCGIKLQRTPNGLYCPRCQKNRVQEVVTDMQFTEVAVIPKEAAVTPGTGSREDGECDRCGYPMSSKCGSICTNCEWIRPCGVNG